MKIEEVIKVEGDKKEEGNQFNLNDGDAERILGGVNPGKPLNPEFIKWAEERMKAMNKEAEEMTEALGLPKEAKPFVLAAMHVVPSQSQPGQPGIGGQQ